MNLQPEFSRLVRFFYSAKIPDGDWSISEIPESDRFIFAKKNAVNEKTQAISKDVFIF